MGSVAGTTSQEQDRVIQQAITQILTPISEKTFSDNSFGFRPKRSAHDAVKKCQEYINQGYNWAVDIDLQAYFDTVNHDILIGLVYKEVKDIRVISLIRKYLKAGVMINGVIKSTGEGVPQGGNLSPLLSNIMLNELDKELTKRELKFARYADDSNIYVKSSKAANRVMASITKFIEGKLKLTVKIKTKFTNLHKLGATKQKAWEHANTRKGYWRISNSPILATTITNAKLKKAGLVSLSEVYAKVS